MNALYINIMSAYARNFQDLQPIPQLLLDPPNLNPTSMYLSVSLILHTYSNFQKTDLSPPFISFIAGQEGLSTSLRQDSQMTMELKQRNITAHSDLNRNTTIHFQECFNLQFSKNKLKQFPKVKRDQTKQRNILFLQKSEEI